MNTSHVQPTLLSSETLNESEDRQHLEDLTRTATLPPIPPRIPHLLSSTSSSSFTSAPSPSPSSTSTSSARLKQIAPAPLHIPDQQHHQQQQLYFQQQQHLQPHQILQHQQQHQIYLQQQQQQQQYLQQQQQQQLPPLPYQQQHNHQYLQTTQPTQPAQMMAYTEHHPYNQHDEMLNPSDFRKRDHEAVHGASLLAPSRSTTPVPPSIPKRPDSRSALYDSGHETMVVDEVKDVLLNVNNNLSVLGLQKQRQQQGYISGEEDELSQQQRRRPVSYHPSGPAANNNAGGGGNGLGQKQGLGHGHDRYSSYDYGVPINYRTGASEYYDDLDNSDSSKAVKVEVRVDASAVHKEPTRPVSLQHPSQTRLSRQEQMLKRSSQVIPVHHKYNHKNNSSATLVEPQQVATTPPPQKEMTKEEREKLEKVFKKKRSLLEKYGPDGSPPPARLESVAHYGNNSQGYLYGDDGSSDGGSILKKSKGRWTDRPSGCLPAGLITFLAFKLSLLYNGALGAILFQASQFDQVGMSPIFGFTIAFFVATGISALGLITVGILASRNYHTGKSIPSRIPLRIFKLAHALYLLCSVLATTACMLSWLALNNSQTGSWTRLQLPSTPATTSNPSIISNAPVLSIESILKPDPNHPGWLIVNPWLWMAAFVALGLVQLYFWFCMVAYARSHLAQWRSGFQTRMRRLEALRALEDGVGRSDSTKTR